MSGDPLNHALFVRTYRGDLEWLVLLLKSCARFVSGYDEIVVAAPHDCHEPIRGMNLTRERVVFVDDAGVRGYIAQQLTKLNADRYTECELITFVDSDCVFTAPFSPRSMMRGDHPILVKSPYERVGDAICWRETTEAVLGRAVTHEYMRRFPLMYRRADIIAARASIEHARRRPLATIASDAEHFSEFNLLGAWCELNRASDYHFIDDSIEQPEPLPCLQFWSRAGITPAVREQMRVIFGE